MNKEMKGVCALNLTENRLYKHRVDSNKVVVVKKIKQGQVTFLHAPPMNSDIHWIIPPKRETLSLSKFKELYKPFKR